MNRSLKILAIIILSVAMCHRQNEANATTIYIRDASIDVCFETRTLAVFVEVDPIAAADSLLGFDIALTFNPEHVLFDRLLTIGTMAEGLEWEAEGNFSTPGVASAVGFNLSRFLRTTERTKLVGFVGRILGDCPQEILLEIPRATFGKLEADGVKTSDQNAEVDGLGKLTAEIRESDKRIVRFGLPELDELLFDEGIDNRAETMLSFVRGEETRQSTVDLEVEIEHSGLFAIESISSLDQGIELRKIEVAEDGNSATFQADFSMLETLSVADFVKIELRNQLNIDTTAELVLRPIQAGECSCITGLLGSSLILKSQKEETTQVDDDLSFGGEASVALSYGPGEWVLETDNAHDGIDVVTVYTLSGQLVFRQRYAYGKHRVGIPNGHIANGMYLAHVITTTGNYIVLNMSK